MKFVISWGWSLEHVSKGFSDTAWGILSKLAHCQHHMRPLCPSSNYPIRFKMAAWRWNLWFLGVGLLSMSANFSQTSLNGILLKLAHCQHHMNPLCPWSNFLFFFKMAVWRWTLWFCKVGLESMLAKFSQTSLNGISWKLSHCHLRPLCQWSNFPIFSKMAALRWSLLFLRLYLMSIQINF